VSEFIVSIENALASFAEKYTPEGSQPKAVVHQWIHEIDSYLIKRMQAVEKFTL
jgi:hypothetical protein